MEEEKKPVRKRAMKKKAAKDKIIEGKKPKAKRCPNKHETPKFSNSKGSL